MTQRTSSPVRSNGTASFLDGSFRLVIGMAAVMVVVIVGHTLLDAVAPSGGDGRSSSPAPVVVDPATFLLAQPVAAPELSLTDQDGSAYSLASARGRPMLVFFGYTHCPDVCPATIGNLGQVLAAYGRDLGAVLVTVDPERDTVAFMGDYIRYLQAGFVGLTGSASQIRAAADAWGVKYARVDTATPGEYSMSHTATVFLVDASGTLRAEFPFGTPPSAMLATLRMLGPGATAGPGSPPASATPGVTAGPTPTATVAAGATEAPIGEVAVEVVSSSVWAGGASPVILRLTGPGGPIRDLGASVAVQLTTVDRVPVGSPVTATAVQPEGVADVSYVAVLDIPSPGWWSAVVTVDNAAVVGAGTGSISAQDPGGTAALGAPAPTARTPTLDDVAGVALAVTTDPLPDLRLSRTSTADALAAGEPFVLVIDSTRFRVTPICGKAIVLAKYLLDRWTDMTFIHLEPYKYSVVTDTAVLEGSLGDPTLVPAADAWGIGATPWGAGSMPWIFIVDGHGIVRAKYQGIVGSADVDVLLTYLAAGR